MMPLSLLDELEQTAKDAGVRVALMSAYLSGQVCELKASVDSLNKLRQPKFTPMAYNADWVEREGD